MAIGAAEKARVRRMEVVEEEHGSKSMGEGKQISKDRGEKIR
ncbi:MAG: hypothetical protein OEZ32_14390 [Nitrospinota bacterium]|nr:hypothetical protein [Nitrospinota bacterium]